MSRHYTPVSRHYTPCQDGFQGYGLPLANPKAGGCRLSAWCKFMPFTNLTFHLGNMLLAMSASLSLVAQTLLFLLDN